MSERRFSCFLEKLLQNRNITVQMLAEQMKLTNRTVIMRILNDKATVSSIKSFAEKLRKEVRLSEHELEKLNVALEYEQLPDSVVRSRRMLSSLFLKKQPNIEKSLFVH